MTFVLDNSVALAWCFRDEQTPELLALLKRVEQYGAFAPQLWLLEALNGLLMSERRNRITCNDRKRLIAFLTSLPIEIDNQNLIGSLPAIEELAQAHALTAYDATYLELAIRLSLPLATRDKALIAAANSAGVPLLETV